jgi:hypothetical protein
MRVLFATIVVFAAVVAVSAGQTAKSADACAGLIGSNGTVNLGRTTTLVAYHDGVEHYITSFEFQGGGGQFGALIPLPAVPSSVERGGAWTLQRLQRETTPQVFAAAAEKSAGSPANVDVLLETRIDALDLTVLRGGGPDVATWAQGHGFLLSADAPEVLDFYAQRSPIFLAAVFDGDAALARGQKLGQGTPVQITMPTDNPWVPLRILALGKQPTDKVDADVYLMTDNEPSLLPAPGAGLNLAYNEPATQSLLADLRADAGMGWMPQSAWLTKLQVSSSAVDLKYDLAVDTAGNNSPSRVAAGLDISVNAIPVVTPEGSAVSAIWLWMAGLAVLALAIVASRRFRRVIEP